MCCVRIGTPVVEVAERPATLQEAIDMAQEVDIAGNTIVLNIGEGHYTTATPVPEGWEPVCEEEPENAD